MNRPSWHEYLMLLAKLLSVRSTCNSRKVGAVIVRNNRVLATGYNGAVHGAPHCIDQGPEFCLRRRIGAHDADKYNYCISSHAEVNAVDQAARFGISLEEQAFTARWNLATGASSNSFRQALRRFTTKSPTNRGIKNSIYIGAGLWSPTTAYGSFGRSRYRARPWIWS